MIGDSDGEHYTSEFTAVLNQTAKAQDAYKLAYNDQTDLPFVRDNIKLGEEYGSSAELRASYKKAYPDFTNEDLQNAVLNAKMKHINENRNKDLNPDPIKFKDIMDKIPQSFADLTPAEIAAFNGHDAKRKPSPAYDHMSPSENVDDRRDEGLFSKTLSVITNGFDVNNFVDDLKHPLTTREDRHRFPELENSNLAKDAGAEDIK